MKQTWKSLFKNTATLEGHSEEYINECFSYADTLLENNLPVVFDVKNLLILWGDERYERVQDFSWAYTEYKIRKKRGGSRTIHAPHPFLKWRQKWILTNVLEPMAICLSDSVHGFVKRRSIKTNAEPHANKNWLINIDISAFFDSITYEQVRELFIGVGYSDEVANYMSLLCTRYNKYSKHRTLPQGAPTSPMLANLIVKAMDSELGDLAGSHGSIYTRYADDITISGNQKIIPIRVRDVSVILHKYGFKINKSKTRIRHKGNRMEVTGLTVSNGVHVPKQYRNEVLRELYFARKYGVDQHCKKKGYTKGFYKEWLLGRIRFIHSIDKLAGDKMLTKFNEIKWLL